MIDALFQGLIKIIFWVISLFSNIIFVPIYAVVQVFIPDLHDYIGNFYTFFNDYLLHGIAFR